MKKSTAIAALGALAQETRLDIFRLLVQKGPAGLPAGEIGDTAGAALADALISPEPTQVCGTGELAAREPIDHLQR